MVGILIVAHDALGIAHGFLSSFGIFGGNPHPS